MDRIILTRHDNHVHMAVEGNFYLLTPGPDPANPAHDAAIASEVELPDLDLAAQILAGADVWPRLQHPAGD